MNNELSRTYCKQSVHDSGHYIHIDVSNKANNAVARLISPQFRNDKSRCLSFWYHMHGVNINRLNIYLSGANGTGPAIWTKQGEQGLRWLNQFVELGVHSDYVKVGHFDIVDCESSNY